jgi:hypothetical protein
MFPNTLQIEDTMQIEDITQVEDTTTTPSTSSKSRINIKADEISFKYINIKYQDARSNMYADVRGLDLLIRGDFSDTVTDIKIDLATNAVSFKMGGIPILNKAKIQINTLLDANLNDFKFTVKENSISLNALALKVDGWVAMPANDIDMDLRLSLQNSDFRNLLSLVPPIYTKDFETIKTDGQLAFSAFAKGSLTDISFPVFAANLFVENAFFQYPELPCAVNDINIDAKITNTGGSIDNTVIDVHTFHFQILENPFDMFAHITTPMSDMNLNVGAKGILNLTDIKKIYPLNKEKTDIDGILNIDVALKGLMSYFDNEQYDKFDAKGKLEISNLVMKKKNLFDNDLLINTAKLNLTSKHVDLQVLKLVIGRNDLSVVGKVENYIPFVLSSNVNLKANVSVNSNYLNVGDFLSQPIATSVTAKSVTTQSADTASSMEIIALPNRIEAAAKLNVKKLIYDNIELNNADVDVSVKDSRLIINNISANLFQGNVKISSIHEAINSLAQQKQKATN